LAKPPNSNCSEVREVRDSEMDAVGVLLNSYLTHCVADRYMIREILYCVYENPRKEADYDRSYDRPL